MNAPRRSTTLFILIAGAITIICSSLLLGPISVSLDDPLLLHSVIIQIRLPRIIGAFVVGGGLTVCGVTLQALLRNSLADPYTLGIASGASCGASVGLLFGSSFMIPQFVPWSVIGGLCGAFLAMFLLISLSRLSGGLSSVTMLLFGVVLSYLFSSILLCLQYVAEITDSFRLVRWLMGSVDTLTLDELYYLVPVVLIGGAEMLRRANELDYLSFGEEFAASRGLNVVRSKWELIIITSVIVGVIVSFVGPIGFLGLIVPHLLRRLVGSPHNLLLPSAALAGGSLLVLSDTLARTVWPPYEVPVGVVTSLIGGPVFIVALFQSERKVQ